MRTIKFHTKEYELVGNNVSLSHFQATIVKGENTFDDIVEDVTGVTEIKILEDGETTAVYNGYTTRLAISIYENDNVSIELINNDIQSQLNTLATSINNVESNVETQGAAIADLGSTVSDVVDNQQAQDAAITDLAGAVDGLVDSQDAQDLAIEDLANAVSGIVEPESDTQ